MTSRTDSDAYSKARELFLKNLSKILLATALGATFVGCATRDYKSSQASTGEYPIQNAVDASPEISESIQLDDADSSCADSPEGSITAAEFVKKRPQDFYEICKATRADLCTDLAARLNDFPGLVPHRPDYFFLVNTLGGSLWDSAREIKLGPLPVRGDEGYLFDNGEMQSVYGVPVGLGGEFFPALFFSNEKLDSAGVLSGDNFASLASIESLPGRGPITLPKYLETNDFSQKNMSGVTTARHGSILYAVFFWSPLSSKNAPESNARVIVAAMDSSSTGEMVCEFSGRFSVKK